MKKLISVITLFAMLTMCVLSVAASDITVSVYYRDNLMANFTMTADGSRNVSMNNVAAVSSNDEDATISIIYNNNNVASFSVSSNEIYAEYSTEDPDVMIISGTEYDVQQGTPVTVSVFYSGKNYSNATDGQIGQLASVLIGVTDADGNWEVEFVPAESADYDVYAGASYREVLMKTVYAMADRSNVIDTIKTADKAGVAAVFNDQAKLKGIVADMSTIEAVDNTGSIGEILYGIRTELDDVDDILKYLDLACAMAVMADEKTAESMENVLTELSDIEISVENLDVYEENKTTEISNLVAKRLANSVDNGVEGLTSSFTNALILGGVEGSNVWADIAPFMELLNNSDYENNVYDVSVAVVGNNYGTVADLEEAIEAAAGSSGGSGSGSGGSSGGGSGGGGGGGSAGGSSGGSFAGNTNTDNLFGIVPEKELEETVNGNENTDGEKLLFLDVPESHWAFDSVHYLYWQDVISGDDTGNFYPDNNITRAEMIKMLCNTFGLEQANKASFEDVASTDWYYGYAGAAHSAGLLQGYDGKMNPNDLLTREDMAVLVYRFAQYAGVEFAPADAGFADAGSISSYATEAIGALNNAGYINGMGDGSFAPKGNSTRAQVAAILYRFITR